jgi:hypothetical protein
MTLRTITVSAMAGSLLIVTFAAAPASAWENITPTPLGVVTFGIDAGQWNRADGCQDLPFTITVDGMPAGTRVFGQVKHSPAGVPTPFDSTSPNVTGRFEVCPSDSGAGYIADGVIRLEKRPLEVSEEFIPDQLLHEALSFVMARMPSTTTLTTLRRSGGRVSGTVKGTGAAIPRGGTVRVQQRKSGRWTTIARTGLSTDGLGRFATRHKLTKGGKYRAVYGGNTVAMPSASAPLRAK